MSNTQKTTLNLRYTPKPDARAALLADLKNILDLCAKEPEFITAILQETPERPDELNVFELWHGTPEDFVRIQGPKEYRKEYIARSKQHIEKVEAIFSSAVQEWGTDLLMR